MADTAVVVCVTEIIVISVFAKHPTSISSMDDRPRINHGLILILSIIAVGLNLLRAKLRNDFTRRGLAVDDDHVVRIHHRGCLQSRSKNAPAEVQVRYTYLRWEVLGLKTVSTWIPSCACSYCSHVIQVASCMQGALISGAFLCMTQKLVSPTLSMPVQLVLGQRVRPLHRAV